MNSKGFVSIAVVVVVVALLAGGAVYFATLSKRSISAREIKISQETSRPKEVGHHQDTRKLLTPAAGQESKINPPPSTGNMHTKNITLREIYTVFQPNKTGLFGEKCEGAGDFELKTFPLDPANIEFIQPMGRVQDSHVTPTNHEYIAASGAVGGSFVTSEPKKYQVRAPADGYIIHVELFKEPIEAQYRDQPYRDNYLVVFEHTCDFYTRLIHIDTLSDRVLSLFKFPDPASQHPYASTRISVKEGEVIGTVGPHSFDFQIISALKKNPHIINPQQLEEISQYTVDTFEYLAEPLRSALLGKNLTTKEPLGGTIAYDIPGRLAGNWFKVGRNRMKQDYWTDELSVVYDYLDPAQIRVSLGNFGGYPKAFGVRGNTPDPAAVGEDSGLIKYELVKFDYYSGQNRWDGIHLAQNLVAKNAEEVAGVVLFQLLPDGKLKVEAFPGQTALPVTGFTSLALMYER